MNVDFNTIATDMLAAMKSVLSNNWPKVEFTVKQFLKGKETRLKMLSEYYLKREITEQEFKSYLEDEKKILEAEIDALKVVSKALTQQAVNLAIDVILKAVKIAI